jgi:hypothetical protein
MNTAEKIASTYLRLNGFLLLPHFTVFAGTRHNHVDLVGLRPPNSVERSFGQKLPRDPELTRAFVNLFGQGASKRPIGLIAEVRSNEKRDKITDAHVNYIREFLGGIEPLRFTFFEAPIEVNRDNAGIAIGLYHAFRWIHWRINRMQKNLPLKKLGSWTLSEAFLADILSMKKVIDSGKVLRARTAKAVAKEKAAVAKH